ncbi:MAG: sulfotransferase [Pseudomonadota bacterium]
MAPLSLDQAGPRDRDPAQTLREVDALLRHGEISRCLASLDRIDPATVPARDRAALHRILLTTAIFTPERTEAAMDLLRSDAVRAHPALGYRLALQMRQPRRAKAIRTAPGVGADLAAEFRWSAALRSLWDGKPGLGLDLYEHRHKAVNFGDFIPKGATYRKLGDGPERELIFIEQGVGDALLHLGLMAAHRARPPRLIIGPPSFGRFVRRHFPASEFRRNDCVHPDLAGAALHASGDYLRVAHRAARAFAPRGFAAPLRRGPWPKFGVCWRGGSAQNRREQRRFALEHFLDLLPTGPRYIALQPNLKDEERALLRANGRIQVPDFDIRSDVADLFDLVSGLAGVIGVDSANWHIAGLSGVPIYGLMNAKRHWYWGPDGEIANVYPNARTVDRHEAETSDLTQWIASAEAAYDARAAPAINRAKGPRAVLITGAPRSGTSMVAGSLARAGLWMGATIKANRDNPTGFFENREIRETILKPNLAAVGADPLGVWALPDLERLAPDPRLARRVMAVLAAHDHDGAAPWGYKEPKLALAWPLWAEAFPDAHWIIAERHSEDVVRSCLRTGFMRKHSADPEFWRAFLSRYRERLRRLEETVPNVTRISSDDVIAGQTAALETVANDLGLTWGDESQALIDVSLWGGG